MARPQGIDTSHYNGAVTVKTLTGCSFAFGQATVGTWRDPAYTADQATFRRAGVVTGAYHYGIYGPGPTRQARAFLDYAGRAELLALDVESRGSAGLPGRPKAIRALLANIRKLDPHKRALGIYSSEQTLAWALYDDLVDFRWVAVYGREPRIKWVFWQKSGAGIDRDEFAGSLAQLYRLAGRT